MAIAVNAIEYLGGVLEVNKAVVEIVSSLGLACVEENCPIQDDPETEFVSNTR